MAKDLFTELGGNVSVVARRRFLGKAHWVEYDINQNGQPISPPDEEEIIFGHLTRHFTSHFEAMVWLKGYKIQGRYLGHGFIDQLQPR